MGREGARGGVSGDNDREREEADGRSKADAAADERYLSYRVVEGPHSTARVSVPLGGAELVVSPQEVSAEILRALKRQASTALGCRGQEGGRDGAGVFR
jgi:molecular chaperone DnaK (HSP70)